jgi:hypothetical protein
MMLFCCCSKSRGNGSDSPNSGGAAGGKTKGRISPPENLFLSQSSHSQSAVTSKSIGRILIEFISEEHKLGLREVEFLDILEKLMLSKKSSDEIGKKEVAAIYKKLADVSVEKVKQFLVQDFFFVDNTR